MGLLGRNPWSPLCLDALNTYYGRSNIPIGAVRGQAYHRQSSYAETIGKELPRKLNSAEEVPDATALYREVLAGQPDKSVVMVSVGQLPSWDGFVYRGLFRASLARR